MKHPLTISILGLGFVLSLPAFAAEYRCIADELDNAITIETNRNVYGEATSSGFTLRMEGLYPEFEGDESSLHDCGYQTHSTMVSYPRGDGVPSLEERYGDLVKTGVRCTTMSAAGGYDFKSHFAIQALQQDISRDPSSFAATITPTGEYRAHYEKLYGKISMLCRKK